MAGHSKWANIKHKKAREDAKKGKIWSKCSRAIMAAAKNGGSDPETNLALRYAIEEAKSANMPKDNIDYAIKKGAGEVGGQNFEVRKHFEKCGGKLGANGCVSYMFQSKGQVFVTKEGPGADEETVMDAALEAGAEDVQDEGEAWQVLTEPSNYLPVREALENANLTIATGQVTLLADNTIACTGEDAEKVIRLIDALEDHDDVQHVYANYEIPDEELAALEQ